MKKLLLLIYITGSVNLLKAQGTMLITAGTSMKTSNTNFLVLDNMNLVNNGSYVQATGEGTTKFTGSTSTTISGTGTTTLDKLEVAVNTGITHTIVSTVSIKDVLTVSSGQLISNGTLVLKSDALTTARLAPITTGSVTGNVVVERYNSNKRAWRLLGIPFSASTQTIKSSWMENGSNAAGFGTQITTFTGDVNAGNFDAQRPSSSIRIYTANNFNSDGTHTPNTTNLITANPAYFLFVRGDRSVDRTTVGAPTSTTVLRAAGTLRQGPITGYGLTGTSFSLIPNPYPSPIDFDAVKAANSSITKFYIWDATLAGTNGVGQYRTIDITGAGPNYTYTATPGGANVNWRFIEPGTAFMIPGSSTVNFAETMKTGNTPPSSMFRVTGNETQLVVNLNKINADNTTSLADGIREVFDNNYAMGIDNDDAKKIAGFELNLGISSGKEILAIEKRSLPTANDIISLNLSSAAQDNYQFEVQPANFSSPLLAYLKDNYLGIYTPIDLTTDTKVNFSITADAASAATNRFSIVFSKAAVSPARSLITVYPNPVQNGVVTLLMNNMPGGIYQVRLLNALGQTILTKQINHAQGTSTETFNINTIKGGYTLEITKPDNSKELNKIISN